MKAADYDGYIIKIGSDYLVAIPYEDLGTKRLSNNRYDAALIYDEIAAERVARAVGGQVVFFNPITGVANG